MRGLLAVSVGGIESNRAMIVSPLTIKKRWKKIDVIRLFNNSDSARRIGAAYSEAYIPDGLSSGSSQRSRFWRPTQSRTSRFSGPELALLAPAAERQH